VDTTESSAPHAHPPTEEPPRRDHQDDVEAHYSGLERLRPHACNDGWITVGQIVVDSETGEETEEYALYLCRECAVRS
jgi:hypothetical protein